MSLINLRNREGLYEALEALEKITASVLLKLFNNGNKISHTTDHC